MTEARYKIGSPVLIDRKPHEIIGVPLGDGDHYGAAPIIAGRNTVQTGWRGALQSELKDNVLYIIATGIAGRQ